MPATAPPAPTDADIRAALGDTYPFWTEIIASVPVVPEWHYYGAKYGFSLKLLEKKRNLCFMTLGEGNIRFAVIYGEKAYARALESDLDEELKQMLRGARKYPEGRGVSLTVTSPEDVTRVRRLLEIKRGS
jgi:hypothetical protein